VKFKRGRKIKKSVGLGIKLNIKLVNCVGYTQIACQMRQMY